MPEPTALWRRGRIVTPIETADAFITAGGRIEWVGQESLLPRDWLGRCDVIHDLGDRLVTPGLIDCHTHLVFAGNRASEFSERLRGVSYEDIARRGGGILATVRATRAASEQQLLEEAAPRLESLMNEGVTTIEIKSGYGLTLEDEAKMLRVARRLGELHRVDVRTTYLAAHAVPPEFAGRADDYLRVLSHEWLPELVRRGLIDTVDVYCDQGAFSAAQAQLLFDAARSAGLPVRMHAAQFAEIGGVEVATRYGALSCDHLEMLTPSDIERMAASGTVAVLLPVAFYCLAQQQAPPVAALRARGVPMAVATDCNPGTSPTASLLLAMNMACRLLGLRAHEALGGVTLHAARALGLGGDRGEIASKARADFVIWNANEPGELAYWSGFNPCRAVIQRGSVVRGML